jgi:hypothetical protein
MIDERCFASNHTFWKKNIDFQKLETIPLRENLVIARYNPTDHVLLIVYY